MLCSVKKKRNCVIEILGYQDIGLLRYWVIILTVREWSGNIPITQYPNIPITQ